MTDSPDDIAEDELPANDNAPTTPLAYLAHLAGQGDISATERDAGEILHQIGRHAISDAPASQHINYKWRYPTGAWSFLFEPKRLVAAKYEEALEAAGTDTRRRALVAKLVAREPDLTNVDNGALVSGLAQIARHWWGAPATATVKRGTVTMPAVRTIDYDKPAANDNNPTPERIKQAGDVVQTAETVRVRDSFERLLVRGQIDEDREVAGVLYAAGVRLQSDYQIAQLTGHYGSMDLSKPVVDGGADGATITERAQAARHNLRMARNAMGRRYAEVVEGVAVHGMTLLDAGRRYCGYRGVDAATTAAKERLNTGLRALACYYGVAVRRAA